MTTPTEDPRLLAGVQMLQRTGATSFQLRYSDDEHPTIWMAVAEYAGGIHEAAAALDPVRAVLRLLETLIDGGRCTHCGRPTGIDPDSIESPPMDQLVCWYLFDPELATFRRGCEGDTSPPP